MTINIKQLYLIIIITFILDPTTTTTSTTTVSTTSTSTTTFQAQIFGNTSNSCFSAKFYGISGGTLITSIEISGNLDNNLSQCCEKCKF